MNQLTVDIAVIGASLGGVLAAWRACQQPQQPPQRIALVAQFDWLGGQMTAQGVPPDEHHAIESGGATKSYLAFRESIRAHYLADANFIDNTEMTEGVNPGDGWVSRLCFEPRIAADYFEAMLAPYVANGQLTILRASSCVRVMCDAREIKSVSITDKKNQHTEIFSRYFCDATDTGQVLALAKYPYRLGKESRSEFDEANAPIEANHLDQQPVTFVMALRNDAPSKTIAMPDQYEHWRDYIVPHYRHRLFSTHMPGEALGHSASLPLFAQNQTLDWWRYRRVVAKHQWRTAKAEVSLINWAQNDYAIAPLLDGAVAEHAVVAAAKSLSASFLYWLQHDAPHPNGVDRGYPALQLDTEALGTDDGFAQQVYVRESRRIIGLDTLTANDITHAGGELIAFNHPQSVGVAWYNMDIHPTCISGHGVNAKVRPFTLPLGAFVPRDCDNLIPACKNISVTHLVNAATRVHPCEWLIGEVAGLLATYAIANQISLTEIVQSHKHVRAFQQQLGLAGIPIQWDDALMEKINAR
jgi:hypothetical protein